MTPIRERAVVRNKQHPLWIGVVTEVSNHYARVVWFEGAAAAGSFRLQDEIVPVENQDEYEFEAALALNDKVKLLQLYRSERDRADRAESTLVEIRKHVLAPNDDLAIYWLGAVMGAPTEIAGAVEARMKQIGTLTEALTPFAAFGQIKHAYPDSALFTMAQTPDGRRVIITFEDLTRAGQALPHVQIDAAPAQTDGEAGGIAQIMEQSS